MNTETKSAQKKGDLITRLATQRQPLTTRGESLKDNVPAAIPLTKTRD